MCSESLPFIENFYKPLLFPLCPRGNCLGVTWDTVSWACSPKNSHRTEQLSAFGLWLFFKPSRVKGVWNAVQQGRRLSGDTEQGHGRHSRLVCRRRGSAFLLDPTQRSAKWWRGPRREPSCSKSVFVFCVRPANGLGEGVREGGQGVWPEHLKRWNFCLPSWEMREGRVGLVVGGMQGSEGGIRGVILPENRICESSSGKRSELDFSIWGLV